MQIKVTDILKKLYVNLDKIIIFLIILLWTFFAYENLTVCKFHTDELWAYVIAKNLNLVEIIKLMHYEGHTFLWYLILKPFTNNLTLYPFIVKYISYVFSFMGIIVFCCFSKINTGIKLLITTSVPLIAIFPVYGRPYSLGILFLFLLCALYKNRLKHPIVYAFLIFFSFNCHIIVLIGALAFGVLFIYDLIKNIKNLDRITFYISICITLFSFLSLAIQWIPVYMPNYVFKFNKIGNFISFFLPGYLSEEIKILYKIIYLQLLSVILLSNILNLKSSRGFYFIIYTFTAMTLFFLFVYPAAQQAYLYFYYIFFVIGYWLMYENSPEFKESKYSRVSLTAYLIIISLIFSPMFRKYGNYQYSTDEYKKATKVIEKIIPEGSTVYVSYSQELIPFLQTKYKVKNSYGFDIDTFETASSIWQKHPLKVDEVKIKKGEKSYYICGIGQCRDKQDMRYKRYNINFMNKEIIDISK